MALAIILVALAHGLERLFVGMTIKLDVLLVLLATYVVWSLYRAAVCSALSCVFRYGSRSVVEVLCVV